MKEFNLAAAKAGFPICTRDGRKARIAEFGEPNQYTNFCLYVLIENENRFSGVYMTKEGHFHNDGISNYDLFMDDREEQMLQQLIDKLTKVENMLTDMTAKPKNTIVKLG